MFSYFISYLLKSKCLVLTVQKILELDSNLYFHCHVDFVNFQALRTLGLIRCTRPTYNFSYYILYLFYVML
jgi:alanine-alpha-ketoisovalerate/valine-pyruvate aminotransferase